MSRKRLRINPRTHGFGYRPELKYKDQQSTTTETAVIWDNNAIFSPMCGVAGGSGASERIGRLITVKSIEIAFELTRDEEAIGAITSEGASEGVFRVLLARDKQTNEANMVLGDVLFLSGVDTWNDLPNLDNRFRFDILWDYKFTLDRKTLTYDSTASAHGMGAVVHTKKMKIRVNDVCSYEGSTGGIGDMMDKSYHLFLMHSAAGKITYAFTARIRYTDT